MLEFKKQDMKKVDTSKFTRPLGKNRLIVPQLEKAFKEFDGKFTFDYEPKRGDRAWHPSGDCKPPASELYKKVTSDEHEDMTGLNKTFMVGHYWHQVIQFLLVENDIVSAESIELEGSKGWGEPTSFDHELNRIVPRTWNDFHWVHGSGDIVPYITKDWSGLIDIKTMRSTAFREPGLPTAFAEKYICQVNIYMDLFDQEQAMFLCVNKDSGEFREITFVRNQPLIDAIYAKWEFVSECITNGHVPTVKDDEEFGLPPIQEALDM